MIPDENQENSIFTASTSKNKEEDKILSRNSELNDLDIPDKNHGIPKKKK